MNLDLETRAFFVRVACELTCGLVAIAVAETLARWLAQ